MAEQPGVQSLERAFQLLETLSSQPEGMHLLEIAKMVGLHKSTVHRLLASMASMGYVRKEPDREGKYRLTLKLFEVGGRAASSLSLLDIARPHLARLCDLAGEAVHLVVRDESDIVYVHKAENPLATYQMGSRIGMRRPLYCTAAGKAILATLPPPEADRLWERSDIVAYTPGTIQTPKQLHRELDKSRERGYAVDNEENELGIYCVAAAVFDYTGLCVGAVSVSVPLVRMPPERVAPLAAQLRATVCAISAEMGYRAERQF